MEIQINKQELEKLLLDKESARLSNVLSALKQAEVEYRIVSINGRGRAVTCDYRTSRANLTILGAKETKTQEEIPENLRQYYHGAKTRESVKFDYSEDTEAYVAKITWG